MRRYSPDHLWIDDDGRVGVTPFVLEQLETVDAVHLPAMGAALRLATRMGALEGSKSTFDLYAPCDGRVVARNEELLEDAAPLARDPETWLVRVEERGRARLLEAAAYLARFGVSSLGRR